MYAVITGYKVFCVLCVITCFRCGVAKKCALLGYYAASNGNFLSTFRDNLSISSSGFKNPKESLQPQYFVYCYIMGHKNFAYGNAVHHEVLYVASRQEPDHKRFTLTK